jgi:hypothetical protein
VGITGFVFRLAGNEYAACLASQMANFKDSEGICDGRMDVQGCSGVHGVASLCGGRVSGKLTYTVNMSRKMILKVFFCL